MHSDLRLSTSRSNVHASFRVEHTMIPPASARGEKEISSPPAGPHRKSRIEKPDYSLERGVMFEPAPVAEAICLYKLRIPGCLGQTACRLKWDHRILAILDDENVALQAAQCAGDQEVAGWSPHAICDPTVRMGPYPGSQLQRCCEDLKGLVQGGRRRRRIMQR